jgi:NADH:ubiquinone oxidoreductase subunit
MSQRRSNASAAEHADKIDCTIGQILSGQIVTLRRVTPPRPSGQARAPGMQPARRLDFIHRWWHERASLPNSVGEPMKTFFLRFFTWWNGATFGTLLTTSLYGEFVGEDEFGNRYYRTKGGKIDPSLGFERRWVIYNGVVEASSVPPSWHGWMHHTVDVPPTQETVVPRPWWKPHRPNLTGTPAAHRPTGSTLAQGRRPKATGDYKAWIPGR